MAKASVDGGRWLEEETGGLVADPKPRYRAEDLIYEAWQTAGPRRVKLARQALELWLDCADAYVLLAQAASGLERARELLEERVWPPASGRWDGGSLHRTPVSSG